MLVLALWALSGLAGSPDPLDSDGDGLSDFQEVHKYRTDPARSDSDGDGIPDGDWRERREFTYVVRTVVQVLRPVTPEYLDDDFQDVRVLDESETVVELEVLHYPFSTAPEALRGDPGWREAAEDPARARWLAPGPTSDWDEELRDELVAALAADGIAVEALDDRSLVERVSAWLLERATYVDRFSTFCTAFDADGEPYVPAALRARLGHDPEELASAWEREISAKGMFRHRERGSCTSTAIYLSGCLRALGIPTRTVLCIPLFDSSDEREWALVREGIRQPGVRGAVLAAMQDARGSWSSHTLVEVLVGGRWWRLDGDELGVGILRPRGFGLYTHVATFSDWADARMPETVGRRQLLGLTSAVLDGTNPYSTISVRDELGERCTLELPVRRLSARVEALFWTDAPSVPVQAGKGRFGLIARMTGVDGSAGLRELLALADLRVDLEAQGHPTLTTAFDPGCWWYRQDHALVYLPIDADDRRDLAAGVPYTVRIRNGAPEARIEPAPSLEVVRIR